MLQSQLVKEVSASVDKVLETTLTVGQTFWCKLGISNCYHQPLQSLSCPDPLGVDTLPRIASGLDSMAIPPLQQGLTWVGLPHDAFISQPNPERNQKGLNHSQSMNSSLQSSFYSCQCHLPANRGGGQESVVLTCRSPSSHWAMLAM